MSLNHTQATVITGPQGSSDVPVSRPETAFVGSVPSQQTSTVGSVPSQQTSSGGSVPSQQTSSVGSVPSQQTSSVGSVPSQQTSSGGSVPSQQESTSGNVPSQQVPPSSCVPIRQPSPTEHGSEEGDLPPPLLPFPMDPGLRETLDRLAEPFTLPEEPHSSAPSMENILEDPRIQSVLNGLFQWATNTMFPTESIFGESVLCPAIV
ncbi:hypothetical protein RCL1_001884 [Eukaryota sp. TZLM3-RCL]